MAKKPTEIERIGLTVEEFAQALNLGRTTVFSLIAKGVIRSTKIGKCRRIHISEGDRLLSGGDLYGAGQAAQPELAAARRGGDE